MTARRSETARPQANRLQSRWTREQIRAARVSPLLPLVQQHLPQCELRERGSHNFELSAYPGLIIKDNYWRWPRRNLAGNTIHPPQFCGGITSGLYGAELPK
jgi:hypothetical protein